MKFGFQVNGTQLAVETVDIESCSALHETSFMKFIFFCLFCFDLILFFAFFLIFLSFYFYSFFVHRWSKETWCDWNTLAIKEILFLVYWREKKFTRPKLGVTGHNSIQVTIEYTADLYTRNLINFSLISAIYSLILIFYFVDKTSEL